MADSSWKSEKPPHGCENSICRPLALGDFWERFSTRLHTCSPASRPVLGGVTSPRWGEDRSPSTLPWTTTREVLFKKSPYASTGNSNGLFHRLRAPTRCSHWCSRLGAAHTPRAARTARVRLCSPRHREPPPGIGAPEAGRPTGSSRPAAARGETNTKGKYRPAG